MNFLQEWLLQVSVTVLLLWGIGGVFLLLLKPKHYRRDFLLIAPFFGFAVISGVSHYLGVLGLAIRQFEWLFIALAVAAPVVWFLRGRPRLYTRLHWHILIIGLATYVMALIPLIKLGYLTTIGTTIDGLSYAVRSDYLQQASLVRPYVPPGQPFYRLVAAHIDLVRAGDVYFVGAVGSLTGQRSYQLLTTTAIVFYALTPVSVYIFCRRTLYLKNAAAIFASGFVAIHNLLLWTVYDNFLSQTIAVSVFPLVLSFGVISARTLRWRETIGFALLLSALFSLYPVYAVLAMLTWGLCTLFIMVQKITRLRGQGGRIFKQYLRWSVILLLLLFIANGVAICRSVVQLTFVGQLLDPETSAAVGAGNISVFPSLAEVWGLIVHASAAYGLDAWHFPDWLLVGGVAFFIFLAVWGWRQLPAGERMTTMIVVAAPILLSVHQRFGMNPPHGYPYGYFKSISLVALMLIPLSVQGLVELLRTRYLRYSAWVFLCGIFLLNSFNTAWTISYVLNDRIAVDKDLIDVEVGIRSVPADKWILLDIQPGVKEYWLIYFLKEQHTDYRELSSVRPVKNPPPTYEYAVIDSSLDTQRQFQAFDEPWYNPDLYRVLWSNATYELRQRIDGALLDARMSGNVKLWYPNEALTIVVDETNTSISLTTETETLLSGMFIRRPQSLAITILVSDVDSQVCLMAECVNLRPGVWTFAVDVNAYNPDSFYLRNAGNEDLIVYGMRAFEVSSGDPTLPFVATHRREGVAFVSQFVDSETLTYEVILIPPSENIPIYRLGLHLFDPQQGKHYGVWGLDFAPGNPRQQGYFRLDLNSRVAHGEVDGSTVPVDLGPFDIEFGEITVQTVWWRLDVPSYLALYRSVQFVRDATSQIEIRSYRSVLPTILIIP
jgi:hypothetical protein